MVRITIGIAGAVLLATCLVATAAEPYINVGDHYLTENQAGQTIQLYVTGGDPVQGLEFNVQIGGGTSGPIFGGIDIFASTIFELNNDGLFPGSYIDPRAAYQGTVTDSGTVDTNGLLATLTIDTTGLFTGQYSLSLINTPEGRTNFAGVYANIVDGRIIIPEPASLAIILFGAGLIVRRRRRS